MNESTTDARLLRVVIPAPFVEQFQRALTLPVTVITAPSLRDEDIAPLLADADVLISTRFSPILASRGEGLRLIQTVGAGLDQIDFAAVPAQATVCNVFGHEIAIAEYVLMAALALNRDLVGMDQRLRQGDWRDHEYQRPQRELRGRTLAVIGLGHIGAEVARYARRLGMRVIAVTRSPDSEMEAELDLAFLGGTGDLLHALAEADFVVLAVPLNATTENLIGPRELNAMKTSAYLINIARANIVNERALYQALQDRTIAGAAVDVWYRSQVADEQCFPANLPFHTLTNIIMTPHVAGWTDGTVEYRWKAINENLRRLIAGESLLSVVREAMSMVRVR